MEVEDLFLRRLQKSAITLDDSLPLLNKHLKGYVPDGRETGIACGKQPAGVDQFTEVKVIHNGTIQYRRPEVKDNLVGSTVVNKFQGQVTKTYMLNLHKKVRTHFGTAEGAIRPLKAIFRQLDFKPMMLGTFAESNNNVREFIETAVEYGMEHLLGTHYCNDNGGCNTHGIAKEVSDTARDGGMEGYANLVMDRYVGTGTTGHNKAHVWQDMIARAYAGEFMEMWMAHKTDESLWDAFPNGWGDMG